jgi:translation initiation factor 2 alpha subunit (eIF-2alpha)
MELEVGDVVLCTVDRIERTIVFVKIENLGQEVEGSIIMSEIAPGRIRNIRDYVVPKKKIVCKILRISGDRIDLSLRRVTLKEKKEVLERDKQERSYISILKSVIGDKAKDIAKQIRKQETIYDFFEEAKKDSKTLEKLIGKKDSDKVITILKSQKKKKSVVKKSFILKTTAPDGLKLIKKLLGNVKEAKINYVSAGKYTIKAESEDIKKADQKLQEILDKLAKDSKKNNMIFSLK